MATKWALLLRCNTFIVKAQAYIENLMSISESWQPKLRDKFVFLHISELPPYGAGHMPFSSHGTYAMWMRGCVVDRKC